MYKYILVLSWAFTISVIHAERDLAPVPPNDAEWQISGDNIFKSIRLLKASALLETEEFSIPLNKQQKDQLEPFVGSLEEIYKLSTSQVLEKIKTEKNSKKIKTWQDILLGRWFGYRGGQMQDSSSPYDEIETTEDKVLFLQALVNPKTTEEELTILFSKTWIKYGYSYDRWQRFQQRKLPTYLRDESDKLSDKLIADRMRKLKEIPPWKLVLAQMKSVQGKFVGESFDGHFTMSTAAANAVPQFVNEVLKSPGTQISLLGRQELYKPLKHESVKSIEPSGNYGFWATDYKGIEISTTDHKRIVLAPFYKGTFNQEDRLSSLQEGETVPFPIFMEGGNLLKVGENLNIISERMIEQNQIAFDFPRKEFLDLLQKTFGPTVVVPYTDAVTGHVDMDVLPFKLKNGQYAVVIPTGDIMADATVEVTKKIMDLATSKKPLWDPSIRNFTKLSDRQEDVKKWDQIAAVIPNETRIFRLPALMSRSWNGSIGTSSLANGVFFLDAKGKSNLILPEYSAAPNFDDIKKQYIKALSPHIDNIQFVDTYSSSLKIDLAQLDGVFHCIAPQCTLKGKAPIAK